MDSIKVTTGGAAEDDDLQGAVDEATAAGGAQLHYKDLTRKAANFRDMAEGRKVYDQYKAMAREKRAKNRVSLRRAEAIVERRYQRRQER